MTAVDRIELPAVGPDPSFPLPSFRRATLANGMRLWAGEHRRSPVLSLILLIPSGAADDPPDQFGLAALTADLLDEGSRDRSAVEIHEALTRIGGRLDTQVSSDATVLSLTTLARHAQAGLALLAGIASKPRFDSTEFDRIRDLRLSRLLQMRQVPSAVADRAFLECLYGSHPYGHLGIGSEASLRALGVGDVADFHRRCYAPARWALIAVGDLPGAQLVDEVEATFGVLANDNELSEVAGTSSVMRAAPPARARLVFVSRAGAVQSEIRLGHVGVPRRSPDYHPLLVLNTVLGGQFVSRINLNLREAKGYTYGARTDFDWRIGRGPFTVCASVQTSATADAIREVVHEIVDIRSRRPVTDAELDVGRAALTRSFPRHFETAAHLAHAGLRLALYDLPDDTFAEFVPRITAIDAADVTRVATDHLRPDDLIAVVVGSHPDVFDSLAGCGFGEPVEPLID